MLLPSQYTPPTPSECTRQENMRGKNYIVFNPILAVFAIHFNTYTQKKKKKVLLLSILLT